jgi:nitrite transporter NirC
VAAGKAAFLRRSPLGFWISSMMAGAYVGLGIILIFCVRANVDPAIRPVAMGASFGIALTLVIFAGSDLFTRHTMFMTLGWLRRRTSLHDLARCWTVSWAGNLLGGAVLAALFVAGGRARLGRQGAADRHRRRRQDEAPALELLTRGILCNWLVCLAIWTSARITMDTAKRIAIFWCLYAFIASGLEHSVANMTLLSIAFLAPHPANVTIAGMGWNLLWVTLGNIISGAGIVALGYWATSRTKQSATAQAEHLAVA